MSTGTQLVFPHIKSLGLVLIQILVGTSLWRAGRAHKKFNRFKKTTIKNKPVQLSDQYDMATFCFLIVIYCQIIQQLSAIN